MSDSDKPKPRTTLSESLEAEDELIIDLVEEIEEDASPDALGSPDRPAIGEASDAAETPDAGIADLAETAFEKEADRPEGGARSAEPAAGESDAAALKEDEDIDWLLDPEEETSSTGSDLRPDASADPGSSGGASIAAAPETEALLDALIPPPAEADSAEEDEDIELIEIEDEDVDDEILRFDDLDLDKTPPVADRIPEAEAPEDLLSDADADLFPETSAADVFAANIASGLTVAEDASVGSAAAAAIAAAAAALVPPSPATPIPSPAPEEPPVTERVSLSAEQIDAALERVIERRLGSTLESIVLRAVETAVTNEIQRLKALLLDEDIHDRTL